VFNSEFIGAKKGVSSATWTGNQCEVLYSNTANMYTGVPIIVPLSSQPYAVGVSGYDGLGFRVRFYDKDGNVVTGPVSFFFVAFALG